MKSLREYLNSDYPSKLSMRINEELTTARIYFNDNIPTYIEENIKNGIFNDYILENLNTHDNDLLIKKIKERYGDKIENTYKAEEGIRLKKGGIVIKGNISNLLDDSFYDLLDFYGYLISINNPNKILIVPKKSDDANEFVYNKNHGQLYHFTNKNNVSSIKKNGLRMKGEDTYRYFPKRIYMYSTTKKLKDIYNISDFIRIVTGEDSLSNVSIFKVDLYGKDIPFYHDDGMEEGAVYCYHNIPSKLLNEIKL